MTRLAAEFDRDTERICSHKSLVLGVLPLNVVPPPCQILVPPSVPGGNDGESESSALIVRFRGDWALSWQAWSCTMKLCNSSICA